MAQGTGIPGLGGPEDFQHVSPDPGAVQAAGMGWEATARATGQLSQEFGAVIKAHVDSVDAAALANQRTALDTDAATIHAKHINDPAGFQAEWQAHKADVLKATPGRHALAIGSYANAIGGRTYDGLVLSSAQHAHELAGQGLEARVQGLDDKITDAFSDGRPLAAVSADPMVQGAMAERLALQNQRVNGGYLSPDLAAEQNDATAAKGKAAAYTGHVLQVYQAKGPEAAVAELQRMERSYVAGPDGVVPPEDAAAWEAGAQLQPHERRLMAAKAGAALQTQIKQDREARVLQSQAQAAAVSDMDERIANSAAYARLYGRPDPNAPTDAQIQSVKGLAGLVEHADRLTTNLKEHDLDGGLAAHETIGAFAARRALDVGLKELPKEIKTPEDLDASWSAIKRNEGGIGRDGRPLVSPQGALGGSQLLLDTAVAQARKMAAGGDSEAAAFIAMPADRQRAKLLDRDQTFNDRIGKAHYGDLLAANSGNPVLATLAYHNGQGFVSGGWTDSHGKHHVGVVQQYGVPDVDMPMEAWLAKVGETAPKGAQYVRDYAAGMHLGRQGAAYDALASRQQTVRSDFVNDPLGKGRDLGLVQPVALNPAGYLQQGAGGQAWQAALSQRVTQGRTLAGTHPGVPEAILTGAERDFIAKDIEAHPEHVPMLAQAAIGAIGQQGAAALLNEVHLKAPEASVAIHTARLFTQNPRAAQAAVDGAQARREGKQEPPHRVADTSWEAVDQKARPAFAMAPDVLTAAVGTARNMHLGDASRGSPLDKPDAYVTAALGGARNGQTNEVFGGVADVNKRPTYLPSWMEQAHATDVLHALGENGKTAGWGPRFSNGQPMGGRDLARMQMVWTGNGGRYRLIDPRAGTQIAAPDGKPFELDLDRARPWIERHVSHAARRGQ